jgi:putative selenium metabolism protein SsnA
MALPVIKDTTVLGFAPAEVHDHTDIVITDDRITHVGPNAGDGLDADTIIDGRGQYVHPGMVCSHHHYYSGLSRGITATIPPSPDFISILKNLWWRMDRALDERSTYYSSLICSIDAIRAGTTSVIDHHASPSFIEGSLHQIKRGFVETGLRGMTCYEMTDRNGGRDELAAGAAENVAFAKEVDADKKADPDGYLVESAIGGHAPFTISDEGLLMMADAVSQSGRGIHLHVAEGAYDVSRSHHMYGKDLLVRLDQFGLIDDKALLVHGIFLSDDEIALLNEKDAFLAHNARSNMNNHVGYNTKLPDIRNLVIGTDGLGPDMFEELKFAFFKHRDAGGPWWPGDFLGAMSHGNELLKRYFGSEFGRIAPGYKADLVISDYLAPTPIEPGNIAGHIAFGLGSSSVKSVMINGKLVMENRSFSYDVQKIYADAAQEARRVWERVESL